MTTTAIILAVILGLAYSVKAPADGIASSVGHVLSAMDGKGKGKHVKVRKMGRRGK